MTSAGIEACGDELRGIGPSLPYGLKAAVTRLRSLAWVARGGVVRDEGLRVLFYHRVSADRDELSVHPSLFAREMQLLADQDYRVVDVVRILDLMAEGQVPGRTIGLSFDDGYLDNAEHALPVLREHGFCATVFVTTAVTDGRSSFVWFEQQPPLLRWDEIVDLDRGGVLTFEAHSLTHPNLLAVDDRRARAEIFGSKAELEERLGRSVSVFSYPAGLFSDRERRLVAQAGYRAAVSCEPGVNRRDTDLFAIRRRQIDGRDSLLDFRAKIAGAHDSPLPFRATYRRLRYGEGVGSPRLASSAR